MTERAPPGRRDFFCAGAASDCGPCCFVPFRKGRAVVEAVLPPIGTGHLPVDEHGTSGVFAAGRIRIGRNDAVCDGFDRAAFSAGEEVPWPRPHGNRRASTVLCPGKWT